MTLARQKRGLQDLHAVARDTHDDAHSTSESCTSPQLYLPTSESVAIAANQNHTTLPPISLHEVRLSSLEPRPLLSSSAPTQPTSLGHHHQATQGPTLQLSQQLHHPKLHVSAAQHHSNYSSARRYSPASSPAHSQQAMAISMLGSGRSVKSELAQIEHTRSIRQLALLAEKVRLICELVWNCASSSCCIGYCQSVHIKCVGSLV